MSLTEKTMKDRKLFSWQFQRTHYCRGQVVSSVAHLLVERCSAEQGPGMEVVITKQATPPVALSKKNHSTTYFPILRGAKSSVQGEDDILHAAG